MNIQLVHSSVLTVNHFVRNQMAGELTVVLCDTSDTLEAQRYMETFKKKVQQVMPLMVPDKLSCYCYTNGRLNCRKLHRNLSTFIQNHPDQKLINQRAEWH
jgi:hypothetical protein